MEEGAFEHLGGAGEPLDLTENPFEDPSMRMAHQLLRNNGFAPAWIEEGKEIEAERRRLETRPDTASDDFVGRVAALNRRILSYNLKAPVGILQKLPFNVA